MRFIHPVLVLWLHLATIVSVPAQPITAAGQPAQLDIRAAGEHSIRVTLKPTGFAGDFPFTPALLMKSSGNPSRGITRASSPRAVPANEICASGRRASSSRAIAIPGYR